MCRQDRIVNESVQMWLKRKGRAIDFGASDGLSVEFLLSDFFPSLQPDEVHLRSSGDVVLGPRRVQLVRERSDKVGERQLGEEQTQEDHLHSARQKGCVSVTGEQLLTMNESNLQLAYTRSTSSCPRQMVSSTPA